jgi:hypothetical protein
MKFAVVMPWPGVKNAEYEFIERLIIAGKNIGAECIVINNEGRIVEDNKVLTNKSLQDGEVEFVLSLHYTTPKLTNNFYYLALWNPSDFFFNHEYINYSKNVIMSDDFLVYKSAGIFAHTNILIKDLPRNLDDCLPFTPAIPQSFIKPIAIETENPENLKMFYCGINWEKLGGKGRHHELFQLLDKTGKLKIFGPEVFLKVRVWEGYNSYSGEIPFDGKSVIDEINKCGISLVVSSESHRKSGAASSRLYESISAGAVVISDDNSFVKENFSDSVLFFKYYKDNPQKNFEQIIELYNWIVANPKQALEKAKIAQQKFKEKYILENQIKHIFDNTNIRKSNSELYTPKNINKKVSIVIIYSENKLENLDSILTSISNQNYPNYEVLFVCDNRLKNDAEKLLGKYKLNEFKILSLEIFDAAFDNAEKANRVKGRGQIIQEIFSQIAGDFILFCDISDNLFTDHITSLVNEINGNNEIDFTHSGSVTKHSENTEVSKLYREVRNFDKFPYSEILDFGESYRPAQFLFKKEYVLKFISLLNFSDKYFYFVFIIEAYFKNRFSFTKRMTHLADLALVSIEHSRATTISRENEVNYIRDLFKFTFDIRPTINNMDQASFDSKMAVGLVNLMGKRRLKIKKFFAKFIFSRKLFK